MCCEPCWNDSLRGAKYANGSNAGIRNRDSSQRYVLARTGSDCSDGSGTAEQGSQQERCNVGEERLFPLEIFRGNIIFRNFVGFHFAAIRVRSVFDAADHLGFVVLSLFGQLRDAF